MNVLHLPNNIASQINTTVKAQIDIDINARGIVLSYQNICSSEYIEKFDIPKNIFCLKGINQTAKYLKTVYAAMEWADVIHWYPFPVILPFDLDVCCFGRIRKPHFVEFWGTDIRNPDIASSDNEFIREMYAKNPKLTVKHKKLAANVQKKFANQNFQCLVPDFEIESYVDKNIFPRFHKTRARILMSDFEAFYPDARNKKPLIVHAASRRVLKGTEHIIKAVEQLKKRYCFDFKLIENTPRDQALNIYKNCDIFIVELVSGTYGLAAIESMALGKPTVCFIKDAILPYHGGKFPIVNANQRNIEMVLEKLLQDGNLRNEIGKQSRKYVEEFHDAHKIAKDLKNVYENALKAWK